MINCNCKCKTKSKKSLPKIPKLELTPPKNPFYTITSINPSQSSFNKIFGNRFNILNFTTDYTDQPINYPWITTTCYHYQKSLPGSRYEGNKMVILHITTSIQNKLPFTFLLSHGMSSTLGTLYPFLIDFSTQMKCNIIAYDYSGYGHSQGSPTEDQLRSDIEEVGSFARNTLRVSMEFMILCGMSIGSLPTIDLAVHKDYIHSIGGILLISPLSKGFFQVVKKDNDDTNASEEIKADKEEDQTIQIEMMKERERLNYDDEAIIDVNVHISEGDKGNNNYDDEEIYETYGKARNVQCSVFIIHGKKDRSISYDQSKELAKKFDSVMQWFPSQGDHYNITTDLRYKFYSKARFFIENLIDAFNSKIMRISYQCDILPLSPNHTQKKVIYIEDDYVDYADELNDGLIDYDFQYKHRYSNNNHQMRKKKEILFEILPEENLPNSDGSDGRSSRLLRHVGTFRIRNEDDASLFFEDDNNKSDIEISKKSTINKQQHNTSSIFRSPSMLKSPYISPSNKASVKNIKTLKSIYQRCNTISPSLIKHNHSNKKGLELINENAFISPLIIKKKKSAIVPQISLYPTSAFPDLK